MPKVRVFLFTYNRHNLLPRALQSLINQTFIDWVCELHNDLPGDNFPTEIAKSYNDHRIIIKDHEKNLGPTESFNLAYSNCNEQYISILEDDNWWEPTFLEEMIKIMEENPNISLAWSDMMCWEENQDGSWKRLPFNTWNENDEKLIVFDNLGVRQMHGAIHSNGACIFKSENANNYKIPNSTWFDVIESVRERTFDYPILLLNKPLANFSFTLSTARTKELSAWNAWQIMLCGSFLSNSNWNSKLIREFWNTQKKTTLKRSHHYLLAAVFYPKLFKLISKAPISEIAFSIAYYLKHLKLLIRTINAIKGAKELKLFIDENTSLKMKNKNNEIKN